MKRLSAADIVALQAFGNTKEDEKKIVTLSVNLDITGKEKEIRKFQVDLHKITRGLGLKGVVQAKKVI